MKKLLSVIFMVLCGITAIHAQEQASGNQQRENVACGTEVIMQATPEPNYHFSKWVKQDANGSEDIDVNTSSTSYTCTTDAQTGVNTLKVYLTGGMIDAAQNKILTFTAYFEENSKFDIGAVVVDETGTSGDWGSVSGSGAGYTGDEITLTPSETNTCYEFDHWETSNGVPVDPATMPGLVLEGNNLKVTVGTAKATYKAVFKQKKVTIKVMSADQNKGTVAITSPSAN